MTDPNDTTMGTVSLIFGILGCLNILPCIGAIIAIITGGQAKGTAGESNGKIGRTLGWVGIAIFVFLGILFPIGIFAFGWFTTGFP